MGTIRVKDIANINSSNISNLKYCYNTRELIVKFKKGDSYIYEDVPEEVFNMLSQADSVGKAFFKLIKGKYSYKKLDNLSTESF